MNQAVVFQHQQAQEPAPIQRVANAVLCGGKTVGRYTPCNHLGGIGQLLWA